MSDRCLRREWGWERFCLEPDLLNYFVNQGCEFLDAGVDLAGRDR